MERCSSPVTGTCSNKTRRWWWKSRVRQEFFMMYSNKDADQSRNTCIQWCVCVCVCESELCYACVVCMCVCMLCVRVCVCVIRYEVTQLLLRLWSRRDCRESILEECGSNKFQVSSHPASPLLSPSSSSL